VTGHDASVLDQVRAAPACFGLLDSQAMIDLVACGRAQPIVLVDRPPNQGGPLGSWVRVFDLGGRVTDYLIVDRGLDDLPYKRIVRNEPGQLFLGVVGGERSHAGRRGERLEAVVEAAGLRAVLKSAPTRTAAARRHTIPSFPDDKELVTQGQTRVAEDIGTVAGNPRPGVVCCRRLGKPCSLAARRCHWILRS
jgi:hypothetical protein